MSAITAKASRKMKKYAVLTREPRCFLGSFDFSWEQRKVGEVSESYSGGTPSVGVKEYYGGQIPFIRSAEINSEITELFLTEEGLKNSSARLVAVGDILYALYGATSGEVGRARLKGAINQAILAIKPHTDYDSEYLAQWLRKSKHSIIETYLQGGQGNLSGTIVKELSVDFPSLKEQKAIGDFFRQLDNLITLHQRKCANLCSPSQVVFSLLFATSTFSWEQRKLGEMGQTYTGLSGKTKDDFGHGQARFVTYMNVFSNPISNPEMTEPIEIDPKQNEVEVGDVFFTTSSETPEEVGMSSILLEKRGKTYLNSFCFGFRPSEKIDSYYLAYMLRSESTRAKIILLAQGISRYNISKNKVMEIAVSLPSLDEQKMIGQYFSQLDNLITLHQRECISFTGRADRLILTANKKRTTSSWEQRKLSEITDKVTEKNAGLQYVETFTNSAEFGIISQRDFFDHDIAKLGSLDGYYIVKNEDFVYNPRISTSAPVGPINRNKLGRTGVMSPLYTVFRPHDIDTTYLEYFFKCGYWHSFMNFNGDSGARSDRFSIRDNVFFQMPIPIPDIDEQRKIGELLTCLDNLITLHQRKPFLMKWRTSDANRNQTNRLVL